jgi:hypothetical protein
MSETVPRPEQVECSECGRGMASVRTDFSAVAWPFRYERMAGPETGPVEVRGEEFIAANSPLKEYHGDATAPVKE